MLSSFKFPHSGTRVLATLLVASSLILCQPGECRKKKKQDIPDSFPHIVATQPWAPAISPDFVSSVKREKLLICNKYGRLSIVDFKKAGYKGNVAHVISEITAVGRKTVSLSAYKSRVYALLSDKTDKTKPAVTRLVEIECKKLEEPSVISSSVLENIAEPSIVLADRNSIYVAGKNKASKEIILVLDGRSKKAESGINILSTITAQMPVVALNADNKRLIALCSDGKSSVINFINVASQTAPILERKLDFEGAYNLADRYKDILVIAGKDKNNKPETRSVVLKPEPNVVSGVTLEKLEAITSLLILKNQVLVVGDNSQGRQLLSLSLDKHANLLNSDQIENLSKDKRGTGISHLTWDGKQLYVSNGWSGIETLKPKRDGWEKQFLYAIPRMGASGMASWGNSAILVSGELVKYDLTDPEKPSINARAKLSTPVKSMVGAGSFILCLTRNKLQLRKMEEIDQSISEIEIKGTSVAFDKGEHKAYVIKPFGKLSRVHPIKVYSNSLDSQSNFDLPGNFSRIKATNGNLLVFDLNKIALFKVAENVAKVGSRDFENFAIRDAWLKDDKIIATAIDQNSSGFLLIMDAKDEGLNIISNTPLPHDGTSLSATKDKVISVGKSKKDGRDMVSLIDISNPVAPKEINTMPVIEAASTVTLKDKVALVAGRGLEILLVE